MSKVQCLPAASPVVLIVDDDPEFLAYMATALERSGFVVRAAENGRRALESATAQKPDVVITDIYMPQADAIDLAAGLNRELPGVPMIAVTGGEPSSMMPVRCYLEHLGVSAILTKPFCSERLIDTVNGALARTSDQPAPAWRAASLSARPSRSHHR